MNKKKSTEQGFKNRGRIQAQGNKVQESEHWSQNNPPSRVEGLQMADILKNRIPLKEAKIRIKEFSKVKKFIEQAYKNGGVSAPVSQKYLVKNTAHERVDLEVIKGIAFIENKKDTK